MKRNDLSKVYILAVVLTMIQPYAWGRSASKASVKEETPQASPEAPSKAAAVVSGALELKVRGMSTQTGDLLIFMTRTANNFPNDSSTAVLRLVIPVVELSPEGFVFHVLPGTYALSCVQDFNRNGKMDQNEFGVPVEPFGFSNNPIIFFGAPSFSSASFVVRQGQTTTVDVKMKEF